MRFGPRLVLLVMCIGLLSAFYSVQEPERDWGRYDFKHYQTFCDALQRANQLRLYEGLPHQVYEAPLLKSELASKATLQLHNFPFYRQLLDFTSDDMDRFVSIFCDNKSVEMEEKLKRRATKFVAASGNRCGGFHPDYCIEWRLDEGTYQIFVCFGCLELRCYGPGLEFWCDMERSAFRELMKKYRKNRPVVAKPVRK